MASGRLKTLLHAQQAHATHNATAQRAVLHVASPRECNTQQAGQRALSAEPIAPKEHAELAALCEMLFAEHGPEVVAEELSRALQRPQEALRCFRVLASQRPPQRVPDPHRTLLRRVGDMLSARAELDLAVVADDAIEDGAVLVAIGRRGQFSCVVRIDPARYDCVRLLELIQAHTVH